MDIYLVRRAGYIQNGSVPVYGCSSDYEAVEWARLNFGGDWEVVDIIVNDSL